MANSVTVKATLQNDLHTWLESLTFEQAVALFDNEEMDDHGEIEVPGMGMMTWELEDSGEGRLYQWWSIDFHDKNLTYEAFLAIKIEEVEDESTSASRDSSENS